MEKFYVVEDINSGEMHGFRTIEKARSFMLNFWMNNLEDYYGAGCDLDKDGLLKYIKEDLTDLVAALPKIEDVMYIREVTVDE